ncbi:glycosyltransferase family 9 protein [soil metagenome]
MMLFLTLFLKRKRSIPTGKISKILFVKLAAIGDTVLLIPTVRTLKKTFPEAEITFVCTPVNYSIVKNIPYVDKVININVHSFIKNIFSFFKFLKEYRSIEYDISIDGGQWERMSALMAVLSRSKYYIGFKTKGQYKHFLYDSIILHSPDTHETENFLELLEPLNIKVTSEDKKLEYFLSGDDFKFAEDFWIKNDLFGKNVIAFHPGCGVDGKAKEWDPDNFVELGKRLLKNDQNYRFIITGTEVEWVLNESISKAIGNKAINLAGKATVSQAIAILKKSDAVICPNTGILHMAASVNSRIIALHGPSNTLKWGPYNDRSVVVQSDKFCSPCTYIGKDFGCKVPTCMSHITVDDVYFEVRKAINPKLFPEMNIIFN